MTRAVLRRLATMQPAELRFRTACAGRQFLGRVGTRLRKPRWDRADLVKALSRGPAVGSIGLGEAIRALRDRRWQDAHVALASHVVSRPSPFPLAPRSLDELRGAIRARFPNAPADAADRGERILAGRYDLLGFEGVPFGSPPDWHLDPVHQRRAPGGYCHDVAYLDPAGGDHKIIWEINRHQHFLQLGRAWLLTGDRRFYSEFVTQLASWLDENPPLTGVNWASMLELAYRVLSWLWALHMFAPSASALDPLPWTVDLLLGLDRQLTHIERNLSRYFSPNTHLIGEALALYLAGSVLPELASSRRRANVGREVLVEEARRQINQDGGHAELSTHYHRYSTDLYLLALIVARAAGDPAAAVFEEAARGQARFLRTMTTNEGRRAPIGDDDGGMVFPICGRSPEDCCDTLAISAVVLGEPALAVSAAPEEAWWLCGKAAGELDGPEIHHRWASTGLTASGYFVSRTDSDHLIFDAGRHGYLNGGHAHADALAVVASIAGRPLLIDPGTATYTTDPEVRDRFRSSQMHNTVTVDGRTQSRPRGPFHWETTVSAAAAVWRTADGFDYAEGSHRGYAPTVHRRIVMALHGTGWLFLDWLLGEPAGEADAFWHLDPGWSVRSLDAHTLELNAAEGPQVWLATGGAAEILRPGHPSRLSEYSPAYGRIVRSTAIRTRLTETATLTAVVRAESELRAAVRGIPVDRHPPAGWRAAAFVVTLGEREILALSAVEADGAVGTDDAAPGTSWGTAGCRTDARSVLVVRDAGRRGAAALVNGRRISLGGRVLMQCATRVPLRFESFDGTWDELAGSDAARSQMEVF